LSVPSDDDVRPLVLEYARAFIAGYSETIESHFPDPKTIISAAGLAGEYFPIYGRELGVNLAIAVFYTQIDFYLFFLDKSDTEIEAVRSEIAYNHNEFGLAWVSDTPEKRRIQRVREYLGLEESRVLQVSPFIDAVNISGINFIAHDALNMRIDGHRHGVESGTRAGERAENAMPAAKESLRNTARRSGFSERYQRLINADMPPQARGQEFEKLWRDVLDFYGWRPKKVRIPGEDNDFTAIYQGLHILGEVRWFDKPMDGGKMREFLAKLDPRPQTIGLFISWSGVNKGGMSVVRRSVNTKTVVIFEKAEIEMILRGSADLGAVFEEKLRDAYDYIFESSDNS
jgi:hypothetical protein